MEGNDSVCPLDILAGDQKTETQYLTTLVGLKPAYYRVRVVASGDPNDRYVFRRSFIIPESPLDCSPYLINRGMVTKRDEVTITFSSTGLYETFTCQLDGDKPVPCKQSLYPTYL